MAQHHHCSGTVNATTGISFRTSIKDQARLVQRGLELGRTDAAGIPRMVRDSTAERDTDSESLHWEPRVVPSRPSPAVLPTPWQPWQPYYMNLILWFWKIAIWSILTHTHLFLGSKGRESTSCEEMITVLSWLGVVFNAYLAIRLSIQSRWNHMQEFICDFIIVAVLQSLHFCEVIFVSPLCEHMSCSAHFDTWTVFAFARPQWLPWLMQPKALKQKCVTSLLFGTQTQGCCQSFKCLSFLQKMGHIWEPTDYRWPQMWSHCCTGRALLARFESGHWCCWALNTGKLHCRAQQPWHKQEKQKNTYSTKQRSAEDSNKIRQILIEFLLNS